MRSGVVGVDTVICLRLYGQMRASANGYGGLKVPTFCIVHHGLSRQEQAYRLSAKPKSRSLRLCVSDVMQRRSRLSDCCGRVHSAGCRSAA